MQEKPSDKPIQVFPIPRTEEQIAQHVLNPKPTGEVLLPRPPLDVVGVRPGPRRFPLKRLPTTLQLGAFEADMKTLFEGQSEGAVVALRQSGKPLFTLTTGYAQAPGDGNIAWSTAVPMHIASMSKLITAIATTQVFDAQGLSFDTPISGYLPAYWQQGPNVNEITFRDLMTHKSGITSGAYDFLSMKAQISAGVTAVGTYLYENMNYSVLRILLPVVAGYISVNEMYQIGDPPLPTDVGWDVFTTNWFVGQVSTNIFAPSQSAGHLIYEASDALAYAYPPFQNSGGGIDGNLIVALGAAGWHMSTDQLLNVMGTFRRGGTIVSPQQAQAMLDANFGVDWIVPSSAGNIYIKNGAWNLGGGQSEQGLLYFLPQDMELVVFANSNVVSNPPGQPLYHTVTDAYLNDLA
jgi:CubicO group peptidase (beta-lactamase class C family)